MENKGKRLAIRLTDEEQKKIREKMKELGIQNMSAYIRKMVLDGYCVKLEMQDIKEMVSLLRYCSNNLNQYAKKANGLGIVYQADIQNLQKRLDDIWEQGKEILIRLASIQ